MPGAEAEADTGTPSAEDETPSTEAPSAKPPKASDRDLRRRLDSVIKRQRELLKETEELREALGRR